MKILRTTHNGSPLGPRYLVMIDGEQYEICGRTLQAFEDGMTVEEMELEPYEEEEDDDDPWDFHDYAGESPESLLRWYHGRVL